MYEYLKGFLRQVTPTYAILEVQNIGYFIHISLNTYSKISGKDTEVKIYIHQVIREDAQVLYGFHDDEERKIFRLLISVSGVGANTARMILSSLSAEEVKTAIQQGNVSQLQNIKGIGAKSAQRLIIDLRDKIGKASMETENFGVANNTIHEEALSALVMLGFNKNTVEKVTSKIVSNDKNLTVEELIKKALKSL